ncbi:MAG: Ni-sirohydrochlorin a,c-diamide synthase, partial [Methanocorpusculum sp.]|nr:Ni-sirohydrochlorin a,c-diamide synthase [Methanocorpusculum sp.]
MKAALFSGNKSGSGKTVITTAIAAYLAKNAAVQTFKTATDYIDASYLSGVTKRPCFNLDSFIQSEDELRALFAY